MGCSSAVISDNKWFESMWKQLVISVVGPRYEHLTHCSLLASGNSLEEQGVIAFHSLPALLRLERCFLDWRNCICGRGNLLSAAPSVLEGILSRASFLFRPPPVPHHIHPTHPSQVLHHILNPSLHPAPHFLQFHFSCSQTIFLFSALWRDWDNTKAGLLQL